jgi:hypothetical protein
MKYTYEMLVKQGEDLYLVLEIQDENSTPIDLTGHTFRGQIRKTASDPTIVASFSFNILNQTTDTGKVEVTLSSAVSSSIQLNSSLQAQRTLTFMAYDIESEYAGRVTRWLEGRAIISPEVTR